MGYLEVQQTAGPSTGPRQRGLEPYGICKIWYEGVQEEAHEGRREIRLIHQASGTNERTESPTPQFPDAEIDLTDEVAPSDVPILVLLREKVRPLRAENDEASSTDRGVAQTPRRRKIAFARERDRAKHAEAENKRLPNA